MSKSAIKPDKQEAIAKLREWFPKGSTVHTILEHVSRSGMSRSIRVVIPVVDEKGQVYFLHPNHSIAVALGWSRSTTPNEGGKAGGCGMDMGFHLAYTLSSVLYGDGYALKHAWV